MNKYFNVYTHSQAIIFSHLEGQYAYEMYHSKQGFFILFTHLGYHYIAGNHPSDKTEVLHVIKQYIKENDSEEFILFMPDSSWDPLKKWLLHNQKSTIDQRILFEFNETKFNSIYADHTFKHKPVIQEEASSVASYPYPVSNIYDNEKVVSYAKGFLIGKNHVEIDISTKENYQNNAMAFENSLTLIYHLLNNKYTPTWTAWSIKKASLHLAKKCGFYQKDTIDAWIWIKDFGL